MKTHDNIIPLDLNFQGKKQSICSYLIKHSSGVVLIESGPGSTLPTLRSELGKLGFGLGDISHIFLTHIHLDHAGAAGELSNYGAEIFVHPFGAPHLLDPTKLITSATRIYADRMDSLWGKFLAVKPDKLKWLENDQQISIGGLKIQAKFTPGHAEHHVCYFYEGVCFSGDVGGIRIPGYKYLRIPMPPPELNLEKWKVTLQQLKAEKFKYLAPTHFGFYNDVQWHLDSLRKNIDAAERWMEKNLNGDQDVEKLKMEFENWMNEQAVEQKMTPEVITAFALSNPIAMSVDGMLRYWNKHLRPN